jgi:hypothetical protein
MRSDVLGVFIPADEGTYTSVFYAASKDMKSEMSGEYFVPLGKVGKPSRNAQDAEMATKMWKWTVDVFGTKQIL